ncbi:hypothetical protein IT418_04370 [bacterium]|nr:hypothetical protein [bacterium]
MIELVITLQILGIITLLVFIGLMGYVLFLLGKIGKKIDTFLEMIEYYEKAKESVVDFINGPAISYIKTAKSIFSLISPMLTRRGNSR